MEGRLLGVKKRTKVFRDSIHGDIRVGPMQRAIIDTDAFQRLRYIRQNGLLHYVFPGAVHTRFAHSLGTMHIAQRLFSALFPAYRSGERADRDSIFTAYVGTVFEIAALCHDIGHCAFSHSIESLGDGNGRLPFFRSLDTYVSDWRGEYPELGRWWDKHKQAAEAHVAKALADRELSESWLEKVKHEELGMIFMLVLLNNPAQPNIAETFEYVFGREAEYKDFVQDVVALMRGEPWLAHSAFFLECLKHLVADIPLMEGQALPSDRSPQALDLAALLHGLISGTIDVDRFDYLLRDSKHSGTPCGVYDLELLLNSLALRLAQDSNRVVLCVHERARAAIDDFLWSRYQLYEQIINNKANVMLNALFPIAAGELVGTGAFPLLRTFDDFMSFTDDFVMGNVRKLLIEKRASNTSQDRALRGAFLRTRLPRYLEGRRINDWDRLREQELLSQAKAEIAAMHGIPADKIRHTFSHTQLLKATAPLPQVLCRAHLPRSDQTVEVLRPGLSLWGEGARAAPSPTSRMVHFFTEPEGS
jgi:HD superfamily phosphohydrolase